MPVGIAHAAASACRHCWEEPGSRPAGTGVPTEMHHRVMGGSRGGGEGEELVDLATGIK